jgi:hypothetical protein
LAWAIWRTPILPKGEGEGIMYSAFTARELGFGYILSDNQQLQRINENRLGSKYLSKEDAILLSGSAEKHLIIREQFDNYLAG